MSERPQSQSLETALAYLEERGWSVIAVPEASKERVRPWKRFQRCRATPKELRADFAAEGGTPNVAVICGKVSRLVVLDADGPAAEARLAALNLPQTISVRTARGRHRYFHINDGIRSRVLALPDGGQIELRAEGQYVLAPQSRHPSGLLYAFEDPEAPLAELPQAVLDLFPRTPTPSIRAGEGPPQRWLDLVARHLSVRVVWEGQTTDHPDRTGSGHDMRLAHFARRYHFTPDEVAAILRNAPFPVDGGRTPDYLRRTVERAFASPGQRRRPQAGYGQFPAWVVTSGTWARLSERAKAVLPVLVVRAERPSFVVRISMQCLSAEARVSGDRTGKATDELAKAGIIRKAPAQGGRWNLWLQRTPPLTSSAGSAEHVLSDHEWRGSPGPGLSPGGSPVSVGVETEATEKARASMRLDSEMTPEGWKRVYQVQADGSRKLVWQGDFRDWLNWTPPESLRDAVAQDGATLVKTDPDRRCEATTWAGLACVGRPIVGSPFCKRHQTRREPACAPVD